MARSWQFPHVHNRDNTWDSVCSRCLMALGTANSEEELLELEEEHDCKGFNLTRVLHPGEKAQSPP